MEELARIFLALALMLVATAAQSVTPANFTGDSSLGQTDNIIVSVSNGDDMVPVGPVVGLTSAARDDVPPTGISGPVLRTGDSNEVNLQPNQIAIISCDTYPGYITAWDVFSQAVQANVTGILLYSQEAQYCDLEGYTASLQWVYSMKSLNDTTTLLNNIGPPDGSNSQLYAGIGFPDAVRLRNGTAPNGGGENGGNQNQNPLGPSPSTAVAMIILYSITGLITAMFLVIIVTGAWRAHRHPERYGPRNIIGRPRQSRAKGLARAMLETLPIVKFGEREEPKPTDVELADAQSNTGRETNVREAGTTATTTDSMQRSDGGEIREPTSSAPTDGIAAADPTTAAANSDNQGCSICTEDFESGQDQRVLPCDHRFHPACVDPWLLNVSGTCPLCRIDLRPQTSTSDGAREFDELGNPVLREGEFVPPVGTGETAEAQQRMTVRRSIVIGLMGIRPDRLSREERVLALRQLRGQQLARQRREEQANVPETEEEEVGTRTRLRNLLGIRTRRTGQTEESAQPDQNERNGSTE